MTKKFRVFATCDIGESIELLRKRGYDVDVYPSPEAPPKSLIIEKVKSGIDGLITTLRDPIDAEIFEAGKGTLKVVAQIAVGIDNINRAHANHYKSSLYPHCGRADRGQCGVCLLHAGSAGSEDVVGGASYS